MMVYIKVITKIERERMTMIKQLKKLVGIGLLTVSLALSGVTTTVKALDISADITTEQALEIGNNSLTNDATIKDGGKITATGAGVFTLDLAGHTLTVEKGLAVELAGTGVELTVEDTSAEKSGKIICGTEVETCLSVKRGNKLFLKNVEVEAENDVIENIAGELSVTNSTIISKNGRAIIVSNEYDGTDDHGSQTDIINSSLQALVGVYVDRSYDEATEPDDGDKKENNVTITRGEKSTIIKSPAVDFQFAVTDFIGDLDKIVILNITKDQTKTLSLDYDQALKEEEENEYSVVRRADYEDYVKLMDELLAILEDIIDGKYDETSAEAFGEHLELLDFTLEDFGDGPFGELLSLGLDNQFLAADEQPRLDALVAQVKALFSEAQLLLKEAVVATPVEATSTPVVETTTTETVYTHYAEEVQPEEAPVVEEAKPEVKADKEEKKEEAKESNPIYLIIGVIILLGLIGWRVLSNKRQAES